ncbi:MAG TPA: PQQ-binding-like beta-propeller repeat protein, partial [Micromonosporaceae bacterium]
LKPANVLLTDVGPYVIDFGVAMPENATRLTSGVVLGTPGFMAPELIEGERGSPASDIFSLGATLVFAATGHGVVKGDNLAAQLVQMTRGRYDLAEVPAGLRPLIIRCLARNAKDRPTAGEIARTLVGAGVVAPGPGWFGAAWPIDAGTAGLSRVPRHVSRRRLLLGAAGLTGLVLAVGAWRSLSGGTAVNAARQGRQLWQATVNSDGRFRLLAGSARVVVPCDDGSTVAVDHGTGQQRWFSTDRACDLAGATALVVGVPAVGGTTDGPDPVEPPGVGLVHLEDGTVAVRVPLDPSRYGQFRQARATGNGVLLVFAGAVLALDGAGKRQWEWRPDPGTAVVRAAPLSIGALVVLEPADRQRSEVWLVVIEGGAEVRRWAPASEDGALPGDEVGAVLVSGERAIVLAASWQLAVEPDLSPLWLHRHRLPTDDHHLFHDRVVQAAGRIIVPDRGRVWAIADSDGEVAWTTPIGAGATLAAARPDGRTYVVAGGALHELTEQGEVVWRADLPDPVERSLPAALAVDEYAGYLLVRESGAERVPLSANLLALTLD